MLKDLLITPLPAPARVRVSGKHETLQHPSLTPTKGHPMPQFIACEEGDAT